MKKFLVDQGLAISAMVAIPGSASVACGKAASGSGAGAGTSIWGGGATTVSARFGLMTQRVPRTRISNTTTNPATRRIAVFVADARREAGVGTPGIWGISVLNRSAGGWSDIGSLETPRLPMHQVTSRRESLCAEKGSAPLRAYCKASARDEQQNQHHTCQIMP